MENENFLAKLLFYIGVIIILGSVVVGFLNGNLGRMSSPPYGYNFSMLMFILTSVRGFAIGMLFIGFSEVIKLLQGIQNATKKLNADMQGIRSTMEDVKNKPLE